MRHLRGFIETTRLREYNKLSCPPGLIFSEKILTVYLKRDRYLLYNMYTHDRLTKSALTARSHYRGNGDNSKPQSFIFVQKKEREGRTYRLRELGLASRLVPSHYHDLLSVQTDQLRDIVTNSFDTIAKLSWVNHTQIFHKQ